MNLSNEQLERLKKIWTQQTTASNSTEPYVIKPNKSKSWEAVTAYLNQTKTKKK